MDFPLQPPKDPRTTTEAGIGSYHITKHSDFAEVEAFDEGGTLLADCTAEWPEGSKVLTCTMGDGGRFRATWYRRHAKFEDLLGDDYIVLRFTASPDEIRDPSRATRPADQRGWSLEGTKTWGEVEREWGAITPVFGYLMGEVEITLGTLFDDIREGGESQGGDP